MDIKLLCKKIIQSNVEYYYDYKIKDVKIKYFIFKNPGKRFFQNLVGRFF